MLSNSSRGVVSAASMADTWITDLTHFLKDGRLPQELPGPALRLAEYLGRIVAAVTGAEADDSLGVRCRRSQAARLLNGTKRISTRLLSAVAMRRSIAKEWPS